MTMQRNVTLKVSDAEYWLLHAALTAAIDQFHADARRWSDTRSESVGEEFRKYAKQTASLRELFSMQYSATEGN